tara:strand:+ start:116 stop:562 length:447 start_codon:yes stop_codon:yes gene_type:complete
MPNFNKSKRIDKTNFSAKTPELYNKKNPLNYHTGGQSGKRGVKKGYAKLDKSKMADFKGGYAPIGGAGGLGRFAGAFANTAKQYLKKSGVFGKNILSAAKQVKGALKPKTTREKVTGMSEKYFKSVEESFKKNPDLKKSSSGYYIFRK